MKRRRAEPGFVAAYQAAMRRLNPDPGFAAANSVLPAPFRVTPAPRSSPL
jgi:hypothetical protein